MEEAKNSVQYIQTQCDKAEKRAAEIQTDLQKIQAETEQKIDALHSSTNSQIENFQIETNNRLESLSKLISDSVKKAVSESEVKHLHILDDVDSQLNSYKKDIEYKLSQIQFSQSDVDNLEKSLRAAMSDVQNRILENFETFTTNQKQKHDDFSNEIKQDSLTIEAKIKDINNSLDDLKTTATGSMSAKLQEFESSFNQKLTTKNNQFDSDLAEWKQDLDSKLTFLKNEYEDSRREFESKYTENFKTNIENLQNRSTEQISKISLSLEQKKEELQNSVDEMQKMISKFKQDANSSISEISSKPKASYAARVSSSLSTTTRIFSILTYFGVLRCSSVPSSSNTYAPVFT